MSQGVGPVPKNEFTDLFSPGPLCDRGVTAERADRGMVGRSPQGGMSGRCSVTLSPVNESQGVCMPKDVGMEGVFFFEVVRRSAGRKGQHLYDVLAIGWV